MQNLKSIRPAEVDNFFKQSFEQKKLIPLYAVVSSLFHPGKTYNFPSPHFEKEKKK